MDETEIIKLKDLLSAAVKKYDDQVADNQKVATELKSMNDKYTELKGEFDKLKEAGDSDAAQKLAKSIEDLQDEMDTKFAKIKQPISAVTDEKQQDALREIARKSFAHAVKKSGGKTDLDTLMSKARERMDVEIKTLNITTAGEGGYAVAEILSRDVLDYAREYSPIMQMLMKKNGLTRSYRQMIRISWPGVAEGIENVAGVVPAVTSTQEYAEVKAKEFKLYASPYITNEALKGVDVDIYSDLISSLGEEIAVYFCNQIWYGDGTDKNARGILSSNRVDITDGTGESFKPSSTRDPDFFPVKGTGVSGAIGATDKAIVDFVIDVCNTLPTRYLNDAYWMMNRNTKGVFEKVRDADERPIFTYDYIEGLPGRRLMLNGFPVVIDDTMPNIAADSFFATFGNLSRAFAYNDGDIDEMLMDPYTKKGGLLVYLEKEFFEMIQRSDALLICCATTNDDVV